MFANPVRLKCCFAMLLAFFSAIASGSVVQAADPAPNNDAELKQLAQSRQTVQEVLNHWNFKTWNQLLADDVVLNIRLGTATKDSAGDAALLGMKVEYKGRDAAKKALREIYGELHKDFNITTEIVHGPDVVLMGELVVTSKGNEPATLPIAVHMEFNPKGKIERMRIHSVDVRAVAAALQPASAALGTR